MADNREQTLFRKKAMERISSPEDLSSYLKVTDPGMWIVLAAVIVLLLGLAAWACVGTLETTADAAVIVQDHRAEIVITGQGADPMEAGMTLRIASQEYLIAYVDLDEYGRAKAYAEVNLPDGNYEAEVVTDRIHPIEFLLESR